jgi:hypothetical protein
MTPPDEQPLLARVGVSRPSRSCAARTRGVRLFRIGAERVRA